MQAMVLIVLGYASMKIIATRKPEQNTAALDPWTAVHLATGLAVGLMAVPLRWALGASVVYEVIEQGFERRDSGQELFETRGPESLPNALADTLAFYVGHRLGAAWNRRT